MVFWNAWYLPYTIIKICSSITTTHWLIHLNTLLRFFYTFTCINLTRIKFTIFIRRTITIIKTALFLIIRNLTFKICILINSVYNCICISSTRTFPSQIFIFFSFYIHCAWSKASSIRIIHNFSSTTIFSITTCLFSISIKNSTFNLFFNFLSDICIYFRWSIITPIIQATSLLTSRFTKRGWFPTTIWILISFMVFGFAFPTRGTWIVFLFSFSRTL